MDTHPVYGIETPYPYLDEAIGVDADTFETLWSLFEHIVVHWELCGPGVSERSQLLVFMQNRITVDLNYYADYRNAASVLSEMVEELGERAAYTTLLMSPAANISPPETRLARARQKVSNEFIVLALAVGGCRSLGAFNAPGFIGGANIPGQVPYRTFDDRSLPDIPGPQGKQGAASNA